MSSEASCIGISVVTTCNFALISTLGILDFYGQNTAVTALAAGLAALSGYLAKHYI
jgi:hypothetical protein